MPGHIFFKAGDYQRAYQSFADSAKTDSDYLRLQNIEPIDNWNYWHNLQFIAANCAESGRSLSGRNEMEPKTSKIAIKKKGRHSKR